MATSRIEILNKKALQLIKGMQDFKLIKVSEDPASRVKAYLKKTRRKSAEAPSLEEIAKLVEEIRTQRYAKN